MPSTGSMAARLTCFVVELHQRRHCEEPRRGDEAIQEAAQAVLDCFASLAMTNQHSCEVLLERRVPAFAGTSASLSDHFASCPGSLTLGTLSISTLRSSLPTFSTLRM